MANIVGQTKNGKTTYRLHFRDKDYVRQAVRLGGLSKKDAEEVARRVDAIVSAQIAATALPPSLAAWLEGISDTLRDRLARAGLVERRQRITLREFIEKYLKEHESAVGERAILNLKATQAKLFAHLNPDCDLRDITEEDARAWRKFLASPQGPKQKRFSQATIAGHIKRAKQFLAAAVEQGYLDASPFKKLVAGSQANAERTVYVPVPAVEKLIDTSPCPQFRLLIGLSRFAALRTPSESLRLKWSDINWSESRMRVEASKTKRYGQGVRQVPISPRLRQLLEQAYEAAEEGSVFCIERHRSQDTNLRTALTRLIDKAGLSCWPRVWHNLRGSAETDWTRTFPAHVCASWCGHSPVVAARHYLTVSESDFARAAGVEVAQRMAQQPTATSATEGNRAQKKTAKTGSVQSELVFAGSEQGEEVRPIGVEHSQKKPGFQAVLPISGATCGADASDLAANPLSQAIALANSNLIAAAAGEALATLSCWLRDLAQLHSIEATIDSHCTLCQLVDALASRGFLSRTQAAQADSVGQSLAACVYGAPRSSQSLVAVLNAAADLLQGK